MKIRLTVGEDLYTATLNDSKATSDFIKLLISDLPKRLSTIDSPDGTDASFGDITYYAPWGNLAIFYRDFGCAKGLVKLGRIESGTDKLASFKGNITVTIEKID
ncbi:cyclophilin-like fold protein [Bacillus halotolerans]|uniref:cyclophilin-like fold protein n=1 Tax=Bacillus halotolerans TaxID=260554 RepID=UPI00273CBF5C|nr:cyclophilin-like fold protein [Bacillus halotolerans]MDP4527378.1 cyclophilin-like fold protein [Bacillus halotolerans]